MEFDTVTSTIKDAAVAATETVKDIAKSAAETLGFSFYTKGTFQDEFLQEIKRENIRQQVCRTLGFSKDLTEGDYVKLLDSMKFLDDRSSGKDKEDSIDRFEKACQEKGCDPYAFLKALYTVSKQDPEIDRRKDMVSSLKLLDGLSHDLSQKFFSDLGDHGRLFYEKMTPAQQHLTPKEFHNLVSYVGAAVCAPPSESQEKREQFLEKFHKDFDQKWEEPSAPETFLQKLAEAANSALETKPYSTLICKVKNLLQKDANFSQMPHTEERVVAPEPSL